MRAFKHFNNSGSSLCPICKKNDDKETVLIGIVGTEDDGNIEAAQTHLNCIDLLYDKNLGLIYQRVLPLGS